MKNSIQQCHTRLNRRFLIGLAAVAMIVSFAAYEFATPARAAESTAAAAAARSTTTA